MEVLTFIQNLKLNMAILLELNEYYEIEGSR
jgi:hypothetical protein